MGQITAKEMALKRAQDRGYKYVWFDGRYWHIAKHNHGVPYWAIEVINVD